MKWTETFTEQSQPPGPSFPPGFTHRVLRRYALPCKTLSSWPKVARFSEGVKKARQGDYSTSEQNASPTVDNSRPHHLESHQDSLLSLLLTMICSAFSPMMRFRPFRSSSGVVREGSPELWRPDGCHQKYWWDEAGNCRVSAMRFVYRELRTRRKRSNPLFHYNDQEFQELNFTSRCRFRKTLERI